MRSPGERTTPSGLPEADGQELQDIELHDPQPKKRVTLISMNPGLENFHTSVLRVIGTLARKMHLSMLPFVRIAIAVDVPHAFEVQMQWL